MEICRYFDRGGETRILKVRTEYDLLVCMAYQVWGSKKDRLQSWNLGDRIIFEVEDNSGVTQFAAVATVVGKSFIHNPSLLWDRDEYAYRIPLLFEQQGIQGQVSHFPSDEI